MSARQSIEELRARAASDLEWPLVCAELAGFTASDVGRQRLLDLQPETKRGAALYRARLTAAALDAEAVGTPIPRVTTPDVEQTLDDARRQRVLAAPELFGVRQLIENAVVLRRFAQAQLGLRPELHQALTAAPELAPLGTELERCLEPDGTVSDRASPELARARAQVKERRRDLMNRLNRLVSRHAERLAGNYYAERDGRYVLPVRSDSHGVIEGSVLGSSSSGATLYVEPRELVELGNKLRVAEADAEREEARVLAKLSGQTWVLAEPLAAAYEAQLESERLVAMTRFAAHVSGVLLIPGEERELVLLSMRHPLLAARGDAVVANDIQLAAGSALIISGPNAGGKTVALKCLGLAAMMVRAGVPVPAATGSRVGFFDEVLSDIGDDQSLALSLSTFSGHVRNVAAMLDIASGDSDDRDGADINAAEPSNSRTFPRGVLILLDELAAGTDPDQGAALATAVLEAMVDAKAAVAVTTHYEALKELAARDPRFVNASVGFDMVALAPTFELRMGVPGPSSALAVAQRFGMALRVVERARELLPEQRLLRDELLASIEHERREAERILGAAKALELATQQASNKLHAETLALAKRERERLEREARELSQAVRQARAELLQVAQRVRQERLDEAGLKQLTRQVDAAGRQLGIGSALDQATRQQPEGASPSPEQLGLGTLVRVLPGGQLGQVAEAPSRGKLKVRVGSLTLTCKLSDLRLASAGDIRAAAQASKAGSGKGAPLGQRRPRGKHKPQAAPPQDDILLRHPGITCDLRGMRVEEAIEAIDSFSDTLLRQGEPAGFVLHGHGTGALKQAVREHLRHAPAVERSRAGEQDEGGDAFTVFWVR